MRLALAKNDGGGFRIAARQRVRSAEFRPAKAQLNAARARHGGFSTLFSGNFRPRRAGKRRGKRMRLVSARRQGSGPAGGFLLPIESEPLGSGSVRVPVLSMTVSTSASRSIASAALSSTPERKQRAGRHHRAGWQARARTDR